MKIVEVNYEIYSNYRVAIFLNDKKLFNLYQTRIDDPWLACETNKNGSG